MIDFPHAHDGGVDWWALGVVLFELLTQEEPWYDPCEDSNQGMNALRALRKSHEFGPDVSLIPASMQSARDFVSGLLCTRPGQRLGAQRDLQEIKEHAWPVQDGFDWNALTRRELHAPFVPFAKIDESTDSFSRSSSSTSAGTDSSEFSSECSETDWTNGWAAAMF
jgi:protein-serine/threonine kinase